MRRRGALFALVTLGAACSDTRLADDPSVTALVGATVIDAGSGTVIPNGVVLIRADRIVAVGERDALRVPGGATEVALDGYWIVPGLIDVHTHLQPWGLPLSLHWGVTTVRNLSTSVAAQDSLIAAALRNRSPRLYTSVAPLDAGPSRWRDALVVNDSQSIAHAVDSILAHSGRWVMTNGGVYAEMLDAVIALARNRGLPLAAALGTTDALTAVRLGAASIEYLSGIPQAAGDSGALYAAYNRSALSGWVASEVSWLGTDPAALMQVARDLAGTGVTLVPTLARHELFSRLDDATIHERSDLALLPDSARVNWDVAGMMQRERWDAGMFADFRGARRVQDAFVQEFVRAGGRIATGSDASAPMMVPGVGVHYEMELLVAAGLTPMEALRAATLRGAELLRAEHLGRVRAEAAADLVVLASDPLRDIRNTRRVSRVMKAGEWVRE